jgi:hypothetical protein
MSLARICWCARNKSTGTAFCEASVLHVPDLVHHRTCHVEQSILKICVAPDPAISTRSGANANCVGTLLTMAAPYTVRSLEGRYQPKRILPCWADGVTGEESAEID